MSSYTHVLSSLFPTSVPLYARMRSKIPTNQTYPSRTPNNALFPSLLPAPLIYTWCHVPKPPASPSITFPLSLFFSSTSPQLPAYSFALSCCWAFFRIGSILVAFITSPLTFSFPPMNSFCAFACPATIFPKSASERERVTMREECERGGFPLARRTGLIREIEGSILSQEEDSRGQGAGDR